MKIYAYILIVLSGVLTAQCSKVTLDEICGYPSAPGGGNGEGEGNGDYNSYMSLFSNGGKPYRFIDILSQLAWGLGYCGMPHILVRFMAIKSEKEIKKSSAIAIIWCFMSLVAACIIGVLGRAYLEYLFITGIWFYNIFINVF